MTSRKFYPLHGFPDGWCTMGKKISSRAAQASPFLRKAATKHLLIIIKLPSQTNKDFLFFI